MRRTWRPTTPCGTLGGSLLSWRTKRQSTLPRDRLITIPEGDFPLFPHPIRRNVANSSSRTGHRDIESHSTLLVEAPRLGVGGRRPQCKASWHRLLGQSEQPSADAGALVLG